MSLCWIVRALALLMGSAVLADTGVAQSDPVWFVNGTLVGKISKKGKEKPAEDLSGIACVQTSGFPRNCLVIDDEAQSAQFVTLTERRIDVGDTIRLIDDKHAGEAVELDGEGVAYHDGHFYVIGSHGRPRSENPNPDDAERAKIAARELASSRVIRIRVDPATGKPTPGTPVQVSTKLKELISADATLGPYTKLPLNQDGITIEGIAIFGGRLYAGFRGPSEQGAAILSAALGAFFDGKAPEAKLHLLPLGEGRGVRDLAVYGNRILILAGPTVGEGGAFSIYSWDGSGTERKLLKDLSPFRAGSKQIKPEAVLPLDADATGLRVLLIFDSVERGAPQAIRIDSPS